MAMLTCPPPPPAATATPTCPPPPTPTPTCPPPPPSLPHPSPHQFSPAVTPHTSPLPAPQSCQPLLSGPTDITDPAAEKLLHPDEIIVKYPKLHNISNAGRLAVRLASKSYFGKNMLRKCTVFGQGSHPALPKDKVMELKKKILSLHPQLLSSPVEFESTWTKCINAINHCGSSLRSKVPPTLGDLRGNTTS